MDVRRREPAASKLIFDGSQHSFMIGALN